MTDARGHSAADIIDSAPVSRLQIVAILLCVLVSVLDGFDTQALAFVAPSILQEWGISKFMLGVMFSATLLGAALGSSVGGILADKFGRRPLVIWMTFLFGIFTGACAIASDFEQLLTFRFIAGIGMGGVIPNMVALASEYAPARSRATITALTLWGFPTGAVLGGLASGPLIGQFGWRSVFVLGAAAPLLLVVALAYRLPESLRFLAAHESNRDKVVALLRRIALERADAVRLGVQRAHASQSSFMAIFQNGLLGTTLLLAFALFFSLILTYMLVSWVPALLTSAGMTVQQGILGSVALNFGGILGSFLLSRWIDRDMRRGALILGGTYIAAALSMVLIRAATGSPQMALGVLALCGFFHIGAQMTVAAFGAAQYPVLLRGTGVGFHQLVGRIGSLIGPTAAGAFLSAGYSSEDLLKLAFAPAAAAAACLLLLAIFHRKNNPALAAI